MVGNQCSMGGKVSAQHYKHQLMVVKTKSIWSSSCTESVFLRQSNSPHCPRCFFHLEVAGGGAMEPSGNPLRAGLVYKSPD